MIRRAACLLAALLLSAIGVLGASTAAFAHATLVSTSPPDAAIVARAPATVSATFDEPVGVSRDSLRVYAPNGQRADNGDTTHGRLPQQITVGLLPGLGTGTYTVGWHVISADSHPVQGAFTFSVGAASSTAVNPASLEPPAGQLVGIAFGAVRWLAYCCFALLIGVVTFLIGCWPGGATRPGVLRLTMGAWGGLAAATLAAILLQGVYGAGQGIGHVFWPDVLHATLHSGYGRALGARLLLVVAALIAFSVILGSLPTANRRRRLAIAASWAAVTIGLASTWAFSGHAGTGIQVPLAVPSDIIHLTAVAVWLGGLVTLVTMVLRRPAPPADAGKPRRRLHQAATAEAARAVSRFSPIALGCVSAIVATGTYQAWRGVGSWGALLATTYGRLLLVKIVAVCALVALGNLARQRVQRLRAPLAAMVAAQASPVREAAPGNLVTAKAGTRARAGHSLRPRRTDTNASGSGGADESAQLNADQAVVTLSRLRWSVSIEVAIVAAVLAVTAVLVNTPTARETYRPPATATAAFDTGGPRGTGNVSVVVTPARLGPNVLRVSVTNANGRPYRPQQIKVVLALPERNLGPLPVQLTSEGVGTYVSAPAIVTITGQWSLRITIRSDAFDEATVTIPVAVH